MAFNTQAARRAVGAVALIGVLAALSACGTSPHAVPSGMMTMPDGNVMSMSGMSSSPSSAGSNSSHGIAASGPSAQARMICGEEIAAAVRRNISAPSVSPGKANWSNQTYTCNYTLAGGALKLSVKDLSSLSEGRAWFEGLRKQLPQPSSIQGLSNLGFPAFQTPHGDVVFLKDGKTLWVDATHVPLASIPPGFTRTGVAYGVAAAVIACWKE